MKFQRLLPGLLTLLLLATTPQTILASETPRNRPVSRIVNGYPVKNNKYPFIVALQQPAFISSDNPYGHECGGSLISPTAILTAAHCMSLTDDNGNFILNKDGSPIITQPSEWTVRLGMTTYGARQGRDATVVRIVTHPKWGDNLESMLYDVAIMTLEQPVNDLPFVRIADPDQERVGARVTVAGWGDIVAQNSNMTLPGIYPKRLQETKVSVINGQKCVAAYAPDMSFESDLQICASSVRTDSCDGDSGGPLFKNIQGVPTQFGIVSYGDGCARGTPAVYTRLSSPEISEFVRQYQ